MYRYVPICIDPDPPFLTGRVSRWRLPRRRSLFPCGHPATNRREDVHVVMPCVLAGVCARACASTRACARARYHVAVLRRPARLDQRYLLDGDRIWPWKDPQERAAAER